MKHTFTKPLGALVVALCLLAGLLPTGAWAAEWTDPTEAWLNDTNNLLYVGDTKVDAANADDIFEDGTASFEVVNGVPTLTLNGASITTPYIMSEGSGTSMGIASSGALTIKLEGDNTVAFDAGSSMASGILSVGDMIITGSGSLRVSVASTAEMCAAVMSQADALSVDNSLTIQGNAITTDGDISLEDAEVKLGTIYLNSNQDALAKDILIHTPHGHPVCGSTCSRVDHVDHDDVPYKPLSQSDFDYAKDHYNAVSNGVMHRNGFFYELAAGNYYLTGDISITADTIQSAEDATVNLCLNGHKIEFTNIGYYGLDVDEGETLNVCNCRDSGMITSDQGCLTTNGTANLYGGTFNAGASSQRDCVKAGTGSLTVDGATLNSTVDGKYALNVTEGAAAVKSGTLSGGVCMASTAGTLTLTGNPTISGTAAALQISIEEGAVTNDAKVDATGYTGEALRMELAADDSVIANKVGQPIVKLGGTPANKFTLTNAGYSLEKKTVGSVNCLVLAPPPHTHSADWACSPAGEQTVTFDKVLTTNADGALLVNGVEATVDVISEGYILPTGNYVLGGDLNLTKNIYFMDESSAKVTATLCLNGHLIRGGASSGCVLSGQNADLVVCDCNKNAEHTFPSAVDGTTPVEFTGGGIVGAAKTSNYEFDTVSWRGGDLKLYGGSIVGNQSDWNILALEENGSALTLEGVTIAGNKSDGAAVYLSSSGTATLKDVKIQDNHSVGDKHTPGAIYVGIYCTLTLSGNPTIDGNTVEGTSEKHTLVVDSFSSNHSTVILGDGLPANFKIPVRPAKKDDGSLRCDLFTNTATKADAFTVEGTGYFIKAQEDGLATVALKITRQPTEENNYTVTATADGPAPSYQWYTANDSGNKVEVLNGKTGATLSGVPAGTYVCEVTWTVNGKETTLLSNPVTVTGTVKLASGQSMEIPGGATITRNGGIITIIKDGIKATAILPYADSDNEVTVDLATGAVLNLPTGTTINTCTDTDTDIGAMQITIQSTSNTVAPGGDVTGRKLQVGSTTLDAGEGKEITADTNNQVSAPSETSVTVTTTDDDGDPIGEEIVVTLPGDEEKPLTVKYGDYKHTLDLPAGATVKTGNTGATITVAQGGEVDQATGAVTAQSVTVGNTTVTAQGNDKVTTDAAGVTTIPADSSAQVTKGDVTTTVTVPESTGTTDVSASVNKDGAVTLPAGGSAATNGTKITAGANNTTVTPGSGDIPAGATVKTGANGTPITVGDEGGTVDENGAVTVPAGTTVTIPGGREGYNDTTTITMPVGDTPGTVTPGDNGAVTVSGGATVQAYDGESVQVGESGGSVDQNGSVTARSVTVTKDDVTTTVTAQGDGNTVTADKEGVTTIPAGATAQIKQDTVTTTVTVPANGDNATVQPDGYVWLPAGGSVTVPGGEGKPDTTITAGAQGGALNTDENGITTVPGGATVRTGTGARITMGSLDTGTVDPATGAVTVLPNRTATIDKNGDGITDATVTIPFVSGATSGTVNSDGSVRLPAGGSVTVPGGTGKDDTTITAGAQGGTVGADESGKTTVPAGATVQTGEKTPVTLGDNTTGALDPATGAVTVPAGGSVTIPGGEGGKAQITVPAGDTPGTVTPGADGGVTVPGGSTVTIPSGEDNKNTIITLPQAGGEVKPGENGVAVPGGSEITKPDGGKETVPDQGGTVAPNGTIRPGPGGDDPDRPTPGDSKLSSGETVTVGDTAIKRDEDNAVTITKDGDVTATVTLPQGTGDVTIHETTGELTLPTGSKVRTGEGHQISLPQGGSVASDGTVTADVSAVLVTENAPAVAVNGLDAEAVAIKTENSGADAVTVTMTVRSKADSAADPEIRAIKEQIPDVAKVALEYLEIKVEKEVKTAAAPNPEPETVSETDTLLEIVLPFDFTGKDKSSVKVYRCHDDKVDTLITTPNPDGEKIVLGREGITVCANKFSTYAVGCTEAPEPSYTGGNVANTYKPNTQQPEHGKITVSPSAPRKGDPVTVTVKPEEGYEVDTVTVTDRDGKPVEVKRSADGTYAFTQPRGKVTVSAALKAATAACAKDETCPIHAFADTDATEWYHDGVHFCLQSGLMSGYGNGSFGPSDTLSRAMLAQILYNQAGKPEVSGAVSFPDLVPGKWYLDAVNWAAEEGIVTGYDTGKFGPDDPITREQLAVMLYRYEQKFGNGGFTGSWMFLLDFTDRAEISEWSYEALCWMTMNKVITGKDGKLLDPKGQATRAEAAAMLQRYIQLDK